MSYIAAAAVADKFKLIDFQLPTPEAAMLHAFGALPSPETVTLVAKDQRAPTAPKQDDLFRLLKSRLAPVKLDHEWFKGGNGMIHKMFANVLANPDAKVIVWDRARYDAWMTEAEARWRKEREERARAEAEEAARKKQSAHGYVYAFHYRHKNVEWMKVGMTDSDDEASCWGRIKDYVKQHDLPRDGWSFIGFIACTEAHALEGRIHRSLSPYRNRRGSARELFSCSLSMYHTVIKDEYAFIMEHEPDDEEQEIERAKQREAKRQAENERAQRESRGKAERETEREARARASTTAEVKTRRKMTNLLYGMDQRTYDKIREKGLLPPNNSQIRKQLGFADEHRMERFPDDFGGRFKVNGWNIEIVTHAENFQHRTWLHCHYCGKRVCNDTGHVCEEIVKAAS